ncbi:MULTISPECIES: hypothetical protein [unclassified Clostridium]|uniref:hypothetical protein n=1 Tax=unclassified Clostridium TaxID=2614128 RepID=UPI000EDCACED|nr:MULTISPECIES: hypothetical protein [unclassified Clostridium]HCQ91099.1 hypothetical protein [Clostridium sp.]
MESEDSLIYVQCIIIIIFTIIYTRKVYFKDIKIEFKNINKSAKGALIAILTSIIITSLYNKYFINSL